ncbi:MAG TPA: radical SAM protein, partial [Candidatus Cybelea sp.]
MLGVYVHLPYCPYLCPYCDFAKWPLRESSARRYLAALEVEIACEPRATAATIYFGGGTPNAYGAETIADLAGRLEERFGAIVERSIELNPELVCDGDVRRYRQAGITRLSVGVQSFEPFEIRTLGRKHSVAQVESVFDAARAAGIASVSLDLMFAVPGQTPA